MQALLSHQGPLRHVSHAHRVASTGFTPVEVAGKTHNLYAKGEVVTYTHARRAPKGVKATVLEVYDLDKNGLPDGYHVKLENGPLVETSEEHLAPYTQTATRVVPTPAPAVAKKEKMQAYAIVVRRHGVCV